MLIIVKVLLTESYLQKNAIIQQCQ